MQQAQCTPCRPMLPSPPLSYSCVWPSVACREQAQHCSLGKTYLSVLQRCTGEHCCGKDKDVGRDSVQLYQGKYGFTHKESLLWKDPLMKKRRRRAPAQEEHNDCWLAAGSVDHDRMPGQSHQHFCPLWEHHGWSRE